MKFSPVLILTLLIGCQNKSDLEGILTAKGVYWTVNIQKNGVFDYGNGKIEFNKDRHYRYYLNSDSTMKERVPKYREVVGPIKKVLKL